MAARKKTKAVAKRSSALPAVPKLGDDYDEQVNRDRATAKAGTWPFIRTAGPGFKLESNDIDNPFDVIVLGAIRQNLYYPEAYGGGQNFPSCYAVAVDGDELGLAPPAALESKESNSCSDCAFNAFGSGAGKGKACRNTVKLAVVGYEPGTKDYTNRRAALLNIPPASIRDWASYNNDITGEDGLSRALFTVVTKVEKIPSPRGQGFAIQASFADAIQDKATLLTLKDRAIEARSVLSQPPLLATDAGDDDAPAAGGRKRRKVTKKAS